MSTLRIVHGEIITPQKVERTDLYINDGKIEFISCGAEYKQTIDAHNCYVTPGLFDLQVNGSEGCDLWAQPNAHQFGKLCVIMLKAGVTAFLPTLITAEISHLLSNISLLESLGVGTFPSQQLNKQILDLIDKNNLSHVLSKGLIQLPGIHLEGPYLSPHRAGAHPANLIRTIELSELTQLIQPSIKLVTLACELPGAKAAIEFLHNKHVAVSLGHSNATFEQAAQGFGEGISIITHIFNALPPIQQRQPGAIIAALLNNDIYCCVICDGLHVDPEMVRLLVKVKGKDKVILVTDIAHIGTKYGSLIGSSITLSQAVINVVNWNIVTFPEAIQMATFNPAKAMKLEHQIGQIVKGGRADLIIWNKSPLSIKHVISNGTTII